MSAYTKILHYRCNYGIFSPFKLFGSKVHLLNRTSIHRNFNSLPWKLLKNSYSGRHRKAQHFFLVCFRQYASKPIKVQFKKTDINRLIALAKPEKWKLLGAVLLLLVSSTVTMAVPFSLGKILDIIYSTSDNFEDAHSKLTNLCSVLIAIFLIGAICNYGRIYLMSTTGYRMTQSLRLKTFASILKQEQGWFDTRTTGELINRLSTDTHMVGQSLTSNVSDGLRSTIMVITGSGMMIYTSPQLAMFGLAIVPPVAALAVVYGRFVRKLTKNVQDTLADSAQVAGERISNIRTVKMFSREDKEMGSYSNAINKILQLGYKEAKARAVFYGLTGLSGNLIIVSVLYYGGVMVSTQALTIGNLTSFLMYAAYIGVSIGGLSSFYSELNKSVGAATVLWELIDRQPSMAIRGVIPSKLPEGHITFKNIYFNYPSRNVEIFKNLKLDIKPGQTVAIVGRSGSGKSTLSSLLLRLYDPIEGQVYLDGHDIKHLDSTWLRKQIGAVSQEPILFSTTIRDNILYGSDEPEKISEEELVRVAKEANVYEFVQNLPKKFDTLVGERGILLSGGQKQRVAIARALIKNPKILILDEATSALDSQSEHLVQDALIKAMKGRTVLTIAHRLSTIQSADYIAVIDNGSVVEQGAFNDLVKLENGFFKSLVEHQI